MSKTNFVENFIAGGVGGACCIATGHPFDTVKVRLQTMLKPLPGAQPLYTGALDCAQKTVKTEGFRVSLQSLFFLYSNNFQALYKGMVTPLVGSAPLFAIFFGGCAVGRWLQQKHPNEKLTSLQNFNAGAFAGIFTSVIVVPGERIKCILQIQSTEKSKKYDGPMDCLKKLYKEGGIRNIYRGTGATLLRGEDSSFRPSTYKVSS